MISRSRHLNRSQTGPVPLDDEKTQNRSSSASCSRLTSGKSSGCDTPAQITFVQPKHPTAQSHSQSLDSGLGQSRSEASSTKFTVMQDQPGMHTNSIERTTCGLFAYKVHEFIHLGNSESSKNIQYICHNNIKYMVNLTGNPSQPLRSSMSCSCLDRAAHIFTPQITLPLTDNTSLKELFETFRSVNDIVAKARNKAEHVLIYSEDGYGSCQAFALAYNIHYYDVTPERAKDNFEKLKLPLILSPFLNNALDQWHEHCRAIKNQECFANLPSVPASKHLEWKSGKRPASVDCSTKSRLAWQ